MTQPTPEAIALSEWREKNWHELDESMKVLVAIRDDEDTSAKERIEAIKGIARLLGAMSTRPADAMKPKTDPSRQTSRTTMTPDEAEEVEGILKLRRYQNSLDKPKS